MNKKLLLGFFIILSFFIIMSEKVYAAQYMYTRRDTILRKGYSNKYKKESILTDGVKIAVIKGTKVRVESKVNDYYYKVTVEADNYYYLKDRTGYIIAKSLTTDVVSKDPANERSLTVSDKTILLKNVMTLVKAEELSNGNINILYPTEESIRKEKAASKDVLRTAGYNFVVNGTPFKSIRTSKNNGKNYYLSCSSFVGAIYNGTFGIDVTKADGSLYWADSYKSYGANQNKGNLFTIVKSTETTGTRVAYQKEMQIGDSLLGTVYKNKLPSGNNLVYSKTSPHIMMYIGDALIAHATNSGLKIQYVDAKSSGGTKLYYMVLGERNIKDTTTGKIVKYGQRFDKGIYVLRIKKGTKRDRNKIEISSDKKKFVLVDAKKK